MAPHRRRRPGQEWYQGAAIDKIGRRHPRDLGEGWRIIDVGGKMVDDLSRRNAGAAHHQRNFEIRLVARVLARVQSVLALVEAVVRTEKDVGVVQLAGRLQGVDHVFHQILEGLYRLSLFPVQVIDIGNLVGGKEWLVLDPGGLVGDVRLIEGIRARGLYAGEIISVPGRGRRRAMRDVGGDVQKERLVRMIGSGIFDKGDRMVGQHIFQVVRVGAAVRNSLSILVQDVVVLRVGNAAVGADPASPSWRYIRAARRRTGVTIEVFAEQRSAVTGVFQPGGHRRALQAVAIHLLETAIG